MNIPLVKYLFFLVIYFLLFSICHTYRIKIKNKFLDTANGNNPKFLQTENPDHAAGSGGGGNNGEFERRDQVTEHILIPLLNTFEVEYPFAPDIKKFRKKYVERINKDIKRSSKAIYPKGLVI